MVCLSGLCLKGVGLGVSGSRLQPQERVITAEEFQWPPNP